MVAGTSKDGLGNMTFGLILLLFLIALIYSLSEGKKYNVFHRFRQTKFAYSGLILSSIQFSVLPQGPLKTMLL